MTVFNTLLNDARDLLLADSFFDDVGGVHTEDDCNIPFTVDIAVDSIRSVVIVGAHDANAKSVGPVAVHFDAFILAIEVAENPLINRRTTPAGPSALTIVENVLLCLHGQAAPNVGGACFYVDGNPAFRRLSGPDPFNPKIEVEGLVRYVAFVRSAFGVKKAP